MGCVVLSQGEGGKGRAVGKGGASALTRWERGLDEPGTGEG